MNNRSQSEEFKKSLRKIKILLSNIKSIGYCLLFSSAVICLGHGDVNCESSLCVLFTKCNRCYNHSDSIGNAWNWRLWIIRNSLEFLLNFECSISEILRFLDTQLGLFEKILRTLRILEKQYVRQLSNRSLFHAGRYLDDMELCYHLQ